MRGSSATAPRSHPLLGTRRRSSRWPRNTGPSTRSSGAIAIRQRCRATSGSAASGSSGRRSANRSWRRWACSITTNAGAFDGSADFVLPAGYAGYTVAAAYQVRRSPCRRGLSRWDAHLDFAYVGGVRPSSLQGKELLMIAFFRDEEGQGLVEYALIIAVIAIAVIVAMIFLRGQIQNIFSNIGNNLT